MTASRSARTVLAAAALLTVLAALSGCAQSGPSRPSSSSSSSSAPSTVPPTTAPPVPASTVVDLLLGFSLGPCQAVSVQAPRLRDDVQALLPEGFVAASSFGSDSTGAIGLDLYRCGNLTTANVQIADTFYGQVYAMIDRPDARVPSAPEAAFNEYVFRVLAGQDVLAALWPAAGYETRNGTADVSVSPPDQVPDLGVRTGDGSVGSAYAVLAQGNRPLVSTPPAWSGSFARYTALADGSVLQWTGTYEVPTLFGGQGTIQVPDDDPIARFEIGNNIPGEARMSESATMSGMDLRRIF